MEKKFIIRLNELCENNFRGNRAEFARAAGITVTTIKSYLDGKTFPRVPDIESIARAGGVSIHWLFTGEVLPSWFGGVTDAGGVYRAGQAKDCNPFLTQIIGWIDEIFGENSPQSVIFYNDLLQRYPSFSEYVKRTTPPPGKRDTPKNDCLAAGE